MSTSLDVSEILNSPNLARDVEMICHTPGYYRLRRWVEGERTNPLRAKRVAQGIAWMVGQKLAAGVADGTPEGS